MIPANDLVHKLVRPFPGDYVATSLSIRDAPRIFALSERRINQFGSAKIGRNVVPRIGFQCNDILFFCTLSSDGTLRAKICFEKRCNKETNRYEHVSNRPLRTLTSKGSEAEHEEAIRSHIATRSLQSVAGARAMISNCRWAKRMGVALVSKRREWLLGLDMIFAGRLRCCCATAAAAYCGSDGGGRLLSSLPRGGRGGRGGRRWVRWGVQR